ncbi:MULTISPECIES: hypothetical protein [unclassified Paenibacillus]|uniref:hypothetical protein n=1 Tax=unclassified Paenibacillus TaxID=185978 RepID=UPI00041BD9D5|nr:MULTISPECIES: hypothetical protein [unclassified Paenibacillus]KGP84616.1 hypothetical protein P364_0104180 [Paenibacillus sp. MAEPY2]KGP86783.1 hypothetical protein P363_0115850 [Paenibacillus sp. MAEPY1]
MIKRIWMLCSLMLLITGCGQNNKEKAIEVLVQNQIHDVTLIVFTDKPVESSFIKQLQTSIDYINNQNLRTKGSITNVNFYNVREGKQFNYEKIFDLQTYPHLVLFEGNQIILETQQPEEMVKYYEKK